MNRIHFKSLRKRYFATQGLLARAMGITQGAVSLWESGARPIPKWAKLMLASLVEKEEKLEDR